MKFTFNGEEAVTHIYGLTFPKGEAVEVTDPFVMRKLSNHPQFVGEGDLDDGSDDLDDSVPPEKRKVGRPKGR